MNKQELSKALEIAKSDKALPKEYLDAFHGFSLDGFRPVHVTLDMVAKLIRYQCFCYFGDVDQKSLEEIAYFGRKRFLIV